MIFRVDISSGAYKDFFLVKFIPTTNVTTFSNDSISFSVSDDGKIGFGGRWKQRVGDGFTYKQISQNMLYDGGIIASANDLKGVSAQNGNSEDYSDFDSAKPFSGANPNIGICEDSQAATENLIGLQVEQKNRPIVF